MTERHKVFVSYHHKLDQYYATYLREKMLEWTGYAWQSIFDDYSVKEDEIDDSNKSSETIRQIIRDEYIKDATVIIVLCGEETKNRKHIDWEIHAGMFNSEKNPKTGFLVINLPTISQSCRAGENSEKEIINPNGGWIAINTRQEYEKRYPYMPIRIIDNFASGITDNTIVPVTVVDWKRIENNSQALKQLIHIAYLRGKDSDLHYDHSRNLKGRNS